ncbi:thiaminase/transcriptional activator TenA [Phyllobacterium ifriqiyense]|uniref:Aminopyrimidine aminohydrolase n=1 Tax=Phyllobacterium ifriqiyense TaxID=314238 RepID=A0ABU0SAC0_9HYPH|nr:TenA family protein [Phyllobacterium ifriqiyense]MDQ0997714.1 thiaminase/transcriptional activator TenA [Phyllobacterium ifriqiyense]
MATETLSERILRENAGVLEEMINHRFVVDIKNDVLSNTVFERYLVYEGAFVDTAISIFAFSVAKAQTIEQKRWLAAVVIALANDQIAYFERTFASRRIDPSSFDTSIPAVKNFCSGMLAIAKDGEFLDIIAAMFAAEWMYWTWSKEASAGNISDPLLKEWVAMHVDQAFADQATWLKDQLDMAGQQGLPEGLCVRLSSIFGYAMQLEIDFHDAPYL